MNENEQTRVDEELIRLVACGDKEAFGCLYERYLASIYRYIYYRISDIHDAEDLTEEVFLRAWNHLQKSRTNPAIRNFRAWLYRVAHNLVVDYHRSKPRANLEQLSKENYIDKLDVGIEEVSIQKLETEELELAIQALEEPLQQIIILRFSNRLSHAETAAILGLKEGHVRVLQYRALKKLRVRLEKD